MPIAKLTPAQAEEMRETLAYLTATSSHVLLLLERRGHDAKIVSDHDPEFVGAETRWRLAIQSAEKFFLKPQRETDGKE